MGETQSLSVALDPYAVGAFIGYLVLNNCHQNLFLTFLFTGNQRIFYRRTKNEPVCSSTFCCGFERSAWLLLGVTGMAYAQGPSAIWAVVGYIIVELFLFLYYARRLRNFTEKRNCITVPDFFSERFDDRDGRLRLVIVVIFLLLMIGYVSAQFAAGGKAFASGFGMGQNLGILITAINVLAYTIIGGFLAVSLTDMFQQFL